jgi:hypothetical protein
MLKATTRPRWDHHRLWSAVVAGSWLIFYVVRAGFGGLVESLRQAHMAPGINAAIFALLTGLLSLALPLGAIWFADLQETTPPGLVRAFGWFLLVVVTWGRMAIIAFG